MEATPPPAAPAVPPTPRQRIVAEAVRAWTRQLVDLGGRNNLLYFRDLRAGTLDLTAALGGPLADRLLEGRPIRLSQLFPMELDLKDAAKRARTIRNKAIENEEERGLQTLHLGLGLATWRSDRSASTPNAPVLLYKLTLHPQGIAGEDFGLETDSEPELNPTFLHLLETDFAVRIAPDDVLAAATAPESEVPDVSDVMRLVTAACSGIPGFTIADRLVAGNFSYAKLPMVRDLERAHDAIGRHALLSAIAGDEAAREELRQRRAQAEALNVPVVPPPDEEFLVLDADSSQSSVIAAALGGSDVVVIGPPGTGKSQTISNLIATLVARGKSVLFVAEKRAAIEAVVTRLDKRGLGDLILDLHDGAGNRRRVAGELDRALEGSSEALAPDVQRLHRQLERRRGELEQYAEQLHARVAPWGLSAFEAQSRILGIATSCRSVVRLRGAALEALLPEIVTEACEDAQRFVELGGPLVSRSGHPWAPAFAAAGAADPGSARAVLDFVHALRTDLMPLLRRQAGPVAETLALPPIASMAQADELAGLLTDVNSVLASFQPAIFDRDLAATVRAMSPARAALPLRLFHSLLGGEYRAARAYLRSVSIVPGASDRRLLEGAGEAYAAQQRWAALAASGRARPVEGSEDLVQTHAQLREYMARLAQEANIDLADLDSFDAIEERLDALEADGAILARFPELLRLDREIRSLHLDPALDVAIAEELSDVETSRLIEHAWLASVLDELRVRQPALAAFTVESQEAATRDFVAADHAHIDIAAGRVRRAWAERAVRARDQYPAEGAHVARQASLKRRHMPLRELFDRAEHVLTAVKPCWVMSPLVVAQVLPSRQSFDVVVFDEASQILPADAACSLLRGGRAVVAGDPHQLPPTIFFSSSGDEEEGDEYDDEAELAPEVTAAREAALTLGQESILDVLRALLPPPHGTRVLSWHYRSKDERLITFSNAQQSLYDWSLTTFPGALPGDAISHVLVPFTPAADRVTASAPEEVTRVVELVREHAASRPEESLGVIALGITHADRISEALRLAAAESPELAAFMDESKPERFFVKNLERVQGDERDAIILTVGYGKTVDGRMRYNFGPINQAGGQRRLNVAITRARRRMTVVSSFGGAEMDPERTTSVGARMLRDYLLYAESRGANLGVHSRQKPPLLPFERDVQMRLEEAGLKVVPQYGASDKWIDFAVMDPADLEHPLIAIEADGRNYIESSSARDRDRLRQEHLERLGWRFHRIWSTDWFRSPESELARVKATFNDATGAILEPPPPPIARPEWMPTGSNAPRTARHAWPSVRRGLGIEDYSPRQIRAVVQWVKSDGRLYTEDELLTEVMEALRFGRRGPRIVAAIQDAIAADRPA